MIDLKLIARIDDILEDGIENHYNIYKIKKRSGKGYRTICAPSPSLKAVQRTLLEKLNKSIVRNTHFSAKGFKKHHSVLRNAISHVDSTTDYNGRPNNINAIRVDIKDAFGSITKYDVKIAFNKILEGKNCNDDLIEKLSQICTFNGSLPQGSPISPALLNVCLYELDYYLIGILTKEFTDKSGITFKYTRFADDMVVSMDTKSQAKKAIPILESTLRYFGLEPNRKKTQIMTPGTGIFITGVNIVNGLFKPCIARKTRANIRSAIYQASKDIDNIDIEKTREVLMGRISHIASINFNHGAKLLRYGMEKGIFPPNTTLMRTDINTLVKIRKPKRFRKYYEQHSQ